MKLEPIVVSLLDTDLYKFNMDQVIFHKHTDLCGEYYFKCRNEGVKFTREMLDEINGQIDHLCSLKFTKKELDYLRSIRFIKDDYVEFLRLWRPIREYVETGLSADGELSIVVKGPLFSAMQFEIYLLEIINEVYFRMTFDYDLLLTSLMRKSRHSMTAPTLSNLPNSAAVAVYPANGRRRSFAALLPKRITASVHPMSISQRSTMLPQSVLTHMNSFRCIRV